MLTGRVKRLLRLHNLPYRVAIAVAVGLLLGVACLCFSPLRTLAALAGAGLVFVTLKRPEIGLLGILIATSSVMFEEKMPRIPVGVGSLYATDGILIGLLGLVILRWMVEPNFKIVRTPLDLPLLAFYGVALLSTLIAVCRSSVGFKMALTRIRYLTYWMASFFVVTNLVRKEHQVRLLFEGLLLLATIVSAAMISQFLLGASIRLLPGRVETLGTEGVVYRGITRILPPGESLILVGCIATTVGLAVSELRPTSVVRFIQWSLLGLAVILTFWRNYWVVVGLALLVLAYQVRGRDRQRLIKWVLLVTFVAGVILLPVFAEPESAPARLVTASLGRLGSLFSSRTFTDPNSSFRWRGPEYKYALPQIVSHPLIGLGLGTTYRPFVQGFDWEGFDGRGYIHNGHVWLLLKTGLLGYLSFAWASLVSLLRGFKYWRQVPDRQMKGIVLGFTLAYLGVLVGSMVNPMLMQWHWMPVIGIMMATNEVILRDVAQVRPVQYGVQ